MKHTNQNSPLANGFVKALPSSSTHAVAEQLKGSLAKGNPIKFGKLRSTKFDPILNRKVNYEVAEPVKTGDPTKQSFVTVLKGNKVAGIQGSKAAALFDQKVKRFYVDIIEDDVEKQILCKLVTRRVDVICYGKVFHFVKTNRGTTILDSRDGGRKSQSFVKAELSRMLGVTEGEAKFNELIGA